MRRIYARFPPSSDVSNIWLITFSITFAFWKKEKALPLCIDVKTPNAPKGAKLYQFFRKIKPPYYIQGHPKFSKKAKALSKVVEGRTLHSVPLASKSIPRKSDLSRPAQQENSAILLRISRRSRARGGLEKNP